MPSVLVFGGAGFIGSALCRAFASRGWKVTAIDGLMPRTAGDARNLEGVADVQLNLRQIVADTDLTAPVAAADLVIDAMGWTRHVDAALDPAYDLQLNLAAHLPLVRATVAVRPPLTIYLGSRHQYGRSPGSIITEATPLVPLDVQGIHKTAAEYHWRRAGADGAAVISLRFGNTFGPRQPRGSGDIGLIGGFIRDLSERGEVVAYSGNRLRNLLYAPDLAAAVVRIADQKFSGFTPLNVAGRDVTIRDLAAAIAAELGGNVREETLPTYLASTEVGEALFDGSAFEKLVGPVSVTPFTEALRNTIEDFHARPN